MKDQGDSQPFYARRGHRIFSGIFGVFLTSVGLYGFCNAAIPLSWLQLLVGIIFILLGGNMAWSAYKSKQSWLSKIGPLP